jgi:uncharacterized repeat protein (TIGR01451 family)
MKLFVRIASFLNISAAGEAVRDQAAQGRREGLSAERASGRTLVPSAPRAKCDQSRALRTRATEDVEMRPANPSEQASQSDSSAPRASGEALVRRGGRRVRRLALIAALSSFACLLAAGPAAAAPSPWWHLTQRVTPTHLSPGGEGTIIVAALNLGDAPVEGEPTITDTLPEGLTLQSVEFFAPNTAFAVNADLGPGGILPSFFGIELCQTTSRTTTCSLDQKLIEEGLLTSPLRPYQQLTMRLRVKDEGASSGALNEVGASGGATVPAVLHRPVPIGTGQIPFGLESFALTPEEEGGATATRAGSHPYQLTTDVSFDNLGSRTLEVPALPRNLHFNLPPGQLGNALAAPQCSDADFARIGVNDSNFCPPDTAIGVTAITLIADPETTEEEVKVVPVFNLTPAPGEPARFGFEAVKNPVILDTAVRDEKGPHGEAPDYGITVTATNITQLANLISATTVFWGAPAAAGHNESRGWGCLSAAAGLNFEQPCEPSNNPKPTAFLTLPTNCAAPFDPLFEGISWPTQAAPGGFDAEPRQSPLADQAGNPLALVGCNQVPFDPRIEAEPTSNAATSPTGLSFGINVDDPGLTNAEGVAQSQIKKVVVTLPEGFTTNPSVAEGLKACSQSAYEGTTVEGPTCPEESKIGEVEIESPLVAQKVKGSLFVAKQGENPNGDAQHPGGNLLTLYLVARNPEIGVMVKQALKVVPNAVTGQLTTEVDDVPQLPFSHFELSFRSGQRSPLVTPPACGSYTVAAALSPWSNPEATVQRESSFKITTGPEGQGCPSGGVPPFHPGLEAGTINNAAGTYSPFYTHITRKDSEQEITRFSIKLPTGVIAKLKGVSECSDAGIAQAKSREVEGGGTVEQEHPSCPANSEVGHSLVGAGVGNVLAYAPGKLYLAGPYHGSPISLVSVTAAKVGPFDLGTVVVRFAIDVNHETAEVSVDGANSDPIPHIVDGIPIHLRDIRAYVDRPGFTLNPTSCAKKSTASTILGSGLNFASSSDDVPVTVSSPFQAADCSSLGFKPKLALSLTGKKTHRGALPAFKAVLTYPKGGAYANIAKAQVTLPGSEFLEQGHLKNVCTRKVFETGKNPGENCPANSIYGHARATTPLLDAPLEGPVYLRTGYGTKLPELAAALNGPQISITLAGKIDSVHVKGTEGSRIRNTFSVVPDAPVEKFVLELKGGKKGLLVNSTDVCKGTHKALAAFTGQNGKLDEYEPALTAQCGKGKKSGAKKKSKGAKGKGGK